MHTRDAIVPALEDVSIQPAGHLTVSFHPSLRWQNLDVALLRLRFAALRGIKIYGNLSSRLSSPHP